MTGKTAFIYHEDYLNYRFGPHHPFKPIREKYTLDLLKNFDVFDGVSQLVEPKSARREELMLVHSEEFIDFVKMKSESGKGYLDYGDTPAKKGIYEATCSRVGGSISAADLVMSGKFLHSFNPGGGLHHASYNRAAGFCVFNDIAVAVRHLQKKYGLERIAIIDIDGHHGDGTQEIFYEEPLLKISFHRYGQRFYPGTGNVDEIGEGPGKGYSVNIPLPLETGHKSYLYAFNEIAIPLIRKYKPEILLNQFGVDGHYEDPLVGLGLTTETYKEISLKMHKLAHEKSEGKYLVFGGGGYKPLNVARCWTIMFITISDIKPKKKKEYDKLHDTLIENRDDPFHIIKDTVKKIKNLIFPFHHL